ncbi:hypothetical protein PCASD_08641 [Puccinia coronata f. sp. avenae]|uniref:Uncharacterized protein n=1 Tax=Puccinia coronata f. sp. avenae TaxID=200324 RepID=A0A2N5V7C4_9BASI|nr:hypothetical protein PCASD_08641 [Puccinia coronata f. sp. avenae]
MCKPTILISFLYVANSVMMADLGVKAAPLNQRDILVAPNVQQLNTLQRRGAYKALIARSPQKQEKKEKKNATLNKQVTSDIAKTTQANDTTKTTQTTDAKTTQTSDTATTILNAANVLFTATANVDNAVLIIQNPNTTQEDVKRAAEEALKNEEAEDFPRQALASASSDPEAAQGALAVFRDKGPEVIGAFKAIASNPGDKQKVRDELTKIALNRLQIVPANLALMGGITGGNRQLVTRFPIGPSQQAVGTKITDPAQRKVVEEHQKALATQTKIVDEQVAIIQKQGAKPEEIEEAAKKALVQEAGEEFARVVLASAGSDAKAAMAALAEVRDNGPSKVIHGLTEIAKNSKDAANVKRNIDLVVQGRKHVVPANLKLIELSGGAAAAGTANSTSAAPTSTTAPGTTAPGTTAPGTTAQGTTAPGTTTPGTTATSNNSTATTAITGSVTKL